MSFLAKNPAIPYSYSIFIAFIKEISSINAYKHIFSTLKILFFGILISFLFSQLLAFLVDNVKWCNEIICYFVDIFRNIPSIALFPLVIAILGIGDEARVFIISIISTPAMFLSTKKEFLSVDKDVLSASSLDCGRFARFFLVKYPLSINGICNGLKIGIGNGFVAVIVAEMLGASKGIGYMVLWTTNAFQYSKSYAYILIIVLLGILFNFAINIMIKIINKKVGVL
jgi:ABC-type nitrate/sulfonate/bicarbonate transport system permease component